MYPSVGTMSRDRSFHGIDALCRTELLLSKGYDVHGIIRRSSSFNTNRLHHLYEDQHERTRYCFVERPDFLAHSSAGPNKFKLHYGDLTDSTNLVYVIAQVQPTEVYNLGAQSHVKVSFEMAEYTVSRCGSKPRTAGLMAGRCGRAGHFALTRRGENMRP